MKSATITLLALAANVFATPLSAQEQDRVAAFIETFDTYCLSRVGNDAPETVPPGARKETTTAHVNGKAITFTSHVLPKAKLSLTQDPKSCAVTTTEPLPDSSVETLAAALGAILARRFPDLQVYDDEELSWMLFRSWMDGTPGTQAAHWGVTLIHPGLKNSPGMGSTTATLALPPVTHPDS